MPLSYRLLLLLSLLPAAAEAQGSSRFLVIHGGRDTIADETFRHDSTGVGGTITRGLGERRERLRYHVTEIDGEIPLVELSAWRAEDPVDVKARQTVRVIFKDDSVAIDEASDKSGINTSLFQTERGAIPYLNLSTAFLELATRRASRSVGMQPVAVPFFDLNGGKTVVGSVKPISADSSVVAIGGVELRFKVDKSGSILGGAVPAQNITIVRGAVP
jgi:hypothetical protein